MDNEVSLAMRELRRAAGLTQAQLAAAIGMAATSVYRYEAGARPDPFSLFVLARYAELKNLTPQRNTFIKALGPVAHLFDAAPLVALEVAESTEEDEISDAIKRQLHRLNATEKVELLAYALFLKQNTDSTRLQVVEFLLQQWRDEAHERFEVPGTYSQAPRSRTPKKFDKSQKRS